MKYFRKECYQSIEDMPIFNWWKVNEERDLSYLFIVRRKFNAEESIILTRIFRKLFDEYIKRYGFAEDFLTILEKERNIALLMIEKAETGDETLRTLIEIDQYNLEQLKKSKSKIKVDFYENKTKIEKNLGFRIDVKVVSVVEFMGYVRTKYE